MEIKELAVEKEGLNTYFELNGEEVKLTKLKNVRELSNAHSCISAVICEQFFELARMHSDENNMELYEIFESQEHLDEAMKIYINEFLTSLIETSLITSRANYEFFKKKREEVQKNKYDA